MSTSNIAQAIDSAFVDRADIKQFIGLPPPEAVYWILKGCLEELMIRNLIERVDLLDWKKLQLVSDKPSTRPHLERIRVSSLRLRSISQDCQQQGMSGRTLRRLPVLAFARYMVGHHEGVGGHERLAHDGGDEEDDDDLSVSQSSHGQDQEDETTGDRRTVSDMGTSLRMEAWLTAIEQVVKEESIQRGELDKLVGTGGV